MVDRRQFTAAALTGIAISAVGHVAQAQGAKEHSEHNEMYKACAKVCSDCQRSCDTCATHCAHLLTDGEKQHIDTLSTCQDCADFCVAAAQIVSRGGPFAALICEGCASACEKCAKECERFPEDKEMKLCAAECRRCEKACRDMAKHAGH